MGVEIYHDARRCAPSRYYAMSREKIFLIKKNSSSWPESVMMAIMWDQNGVNRVWSKPFAKADQTWLITT